MTPIKNHLDNKVDKRYTINKEYSGYVKQSYVVRFCGEWVGHSKHKDEAIAIAQEHYDNHKIDHAVTA